MQHDGSGEVQRSFVEHLNAFAATLPAAEQVLLSQLVALAAAALDVSNEEVEGYLSVPYSSSFFAGLVQEVGLPALDAAGKDATKLTLKFSPEYTRFTK